MIWNEWCEFVTQFVMFKNWVFNLPIHLKKQTLLCRASGKVWERLEKSVNFIQGSAIFGKKVRKSDILAQRCKIQKWLGVKFKIDLVWFLPKSAASHPHTFSDALSMILNVMNIYKWNYLSSSIYTNLSFTEAEF